MSKFVHLHLHTEYSLLDGACRIRDVVKKAKDYGMPAIAITDHGNMHGIVEFYQKCKAEGIKPILGCEVYVAPGSRFDKKITRSDDGDTYGGPAHLVLLAKNQQGYSNLIKLVSKGYTEGFYYKPRVDTELLEQYHEGLICLSACLGGEIPRFIRNGDYDQAREKALYYNELFGINHFYLELQEHGIRDTVEVNKALFRLSEETGIPLVATNDCHYIEKSDARFHDLLLCIQTKRSIFEPSRDEARGGRMKFPSEEFWFKPFEEMAKLFPNHLEALHNTVKIAEMCNVNLEFGKHKLPRFDCPEGFDEKSYLRHLVEDGLKQRYGEITAEIRERAEFEFSVIEEKGFSGYFLIVWDFIKWSRSNGIRVGPGRGSVAGSIIAYAIDIMQIDPLRYNTLFERFLDISRMDPPDIDVDFLDSRRDEVINYVKEKYGEHRVAQIATFGTFGAKGAVKDVARYLLPKEDKKNLRLGDTIAAAIPDDLGISISGALEKSEDLKNLYNSEPEVRDVVDLAIKIEGLPRHSSVHAAAVVIAPADITDYVPIMVKNNIVSTQFSKSPVEGLGLLKMDFLGLKTLTIISNALENIKLDTGEDVVIENISLTDKNTYELLCSGDSSGVFQLESDGMRSILKQLQPSRIEDIIAICALYRPGPMDSIPEYIANANGGNIEYLFPVLEKHLGETYGIIVYQEQVMKIVQDVSGFSPIDANHLRKALSKKKMDKVLSYKKQFIDGGVDRGLDAEKLEILWDKMAKFGEYGFNKSHSSVYGLVAYQTAYLKANYPLHFMAAEITSSMSDTTKVAFYMKEAKAMGIEVLPPDVSLSYKGFRVYENKILFGLQAIKNVGASAIESIVAARETGGPFISLYDFCTRVDLQKVNRRVIEALIYSGAMTSLRAKRAQLVAILDDCLQRAVAEYKSKQNGQVSLFDMFNSAASMTEVPMPNVAEFPQNELLRLEKEYTGLFISGHPLDAFAQGIKEYSTCTSDMVEDLDDKSTIRFGGMVTACRTITTRKGDLMAFVTVEDFSGSLEVVVFPAVYNEYKGFLKPDQVLLLEGDINYRNDKISILLKSCRRVAPDGEGLHLVFNDVDDEKMQYVYHIISENIGITPLYIHVNGKCVKAKPDLFVNVNKELLERLRDVLGEEGVSTLWPQVS